MVRALKTVLLVLLASVSISLGAAEERLGFMIHGVPSVRQDWNLCGAAVLVSVMKYWGCNVSQQAAAKEVFDETLQAASGGDLVRYARMRGFSAYSYAGSLNDLKAKLEMGMPIIVLHESAGSESVGHYRIVIGYDDMLKSLFVIDPLDAGIYSISYDDFLAFWKRFGGWSLLVCPKSRDIFSVELDKSNPVVHFDLAYAYRRHGETKLAEQENRIAAEIGSRQVIVKSGSVHGAKGRANKAATSNTAVSARVR